MPGYCCDRAFFGTISYQKHFQDNIVCRQKAVVGMLVTGFVTKINCWCMEYRQIPYLIVLFL